MKLFILAAGKGTRLWPLTKNTPKSLIDLGDGTTLLERQITGAIASKLFSEVIVLTGYRAEQIEAKLKEYEKQIKISTVYNPFFETTNNLVSLWVAGNLMIEEDFMITNGDNIYKDGVYAKVQSDKDEMIRITIDYKTSYDEDDMKVTLDSHKNVVKVHKEIPLDRTHAESVGLALIKGSRSRRLFVNKILSLVRIKEYLDYYWLVIFNSLVDDGLTVQTAEIDRENWKEVDFHPDITALKKIVMDGF